MLFIPLSIAVLGATTPADGPKASAFINLATQLGGSIAVAGLSVYLDQRQTFHADLLRGAATLGDQTVREFLRTHSLLALSNTIEDQAIVLAYADATYIIAIVAVISLPLVLLMRKAKAANAPVAEPLHEGEPGAVPKAA